jgi:hypothetical protein
MTGQSRQRNEYRCAEKLMNEKELLENYCNNYHLKKREITIDMVMHHWNLESELVGEQLSFSRCTDTGDRR